MKKVVTGAVIALSLFGFSASTGLNAQAKGKTTIVKKTNIKDTKVHISSGTLYSSAKLTKKVHYGKNYKYTTFTRTYQATVKKSNGKKAVYQYIKAGNVKGWIWHSYVKTGDAPKSFSYYTTAYEDYTQGTNMTSRYLQDFDDFTNALQSYDGWGVLTQADFDRDSKALQNIYNLFSGKFSTSQKAHLSAMIQKLSTLPTSNLDEVQDSSDQLGEVAAAIGDAIQSAY